MVIINKPLAYYYINRAVDLVSLDYTRINVF